MTNIDVVVLTLVQCVDFINTSVVNIVDSNDSVFLHNQLIQTIVSAYPEVAVFIFANTCNKIVGERGGVAGRGVNFKLISIISVEPILSSKPHKSPTIFDDTHDSDLRQTVLYGEVFKPHGIGLAKQRNVCKCKH